MSITVIHDAYISLSNCYEHYVYYCKYNKIKPYTEKHYRKRLRELIRG